MTLRSQRHHAPARVRHPVAVLEVCMVDLCLHVRNLGSSFSSVRVAAVLDIISTCGYLHVDQWSLLEDGFEMVWGCLICLMDRWINTQNYWLPKQLWQWVKSVRYKDQECRKIRAERNLEGHFETQTETTTPFRKCCQLIFSSVSSYSTHKRRTLSSCETTLPTATFHHRSANCSTFVLPCNWWSVWIRNWQSSTFDILKACTTRWQTLLYLQVAPLSCTMRVWRRCVRRRSSSVSTSKISTCCWDFALQTVTQIIRISPGSNISTRENYH